MARFQAVLFDFDDTLVNSFPARVKAAEKAALGVLDPDVDLDRIMREWAGRPQLEIWQDLSGNGQVAQTLMDRYWRWYWDETTNEVALFPGVRAMLDELRREGRALAIVTSKARLIERDHRHYGAMVEMDRLGLAGAFDLVVGWEDVQESKPAPAPILFALEKLGLDPRDALMVGDSHVDVTAARRAGVKSAGATWGTVARELLEQANPDYLIDSPSDLCRLATQESDRLSS